MADKIVADLVRGQLCLYGGLLVCVAARPDGLGVNFGISYYGSSPWTFPPYAIALLGCAVFSRRALYVAAPGAPDPAWLRRMANWIAALLAGVVVTPYIVGGAVDLAHTLFGAALFILQLALALRLIRWTGNDPANLLLLAAQLTGGVIAAIYVIPKHGFLIQGQLLFQLAWGVLLIRTVAALPSIRTPSMTRASSG